MLKPNCEAKEFEKYGFKRCKGIARESDCYYLCVARGCKMLFVSNRLFCVNDWKDDDPRIHENPNCKYRDHRDALDIIYDLIKADMLVKLTEISEKSCDKKEICMARPKKKCKKNIRKNIRENISMDPEQYEKLVAYCHREDRPISWAIQKALDNYLSEVEYEKNTAC